MNLYSFSSGSASITYSKEHIDNAGLVVQEVDGLAHAAVGHGLVVGGHANLEEKPEVS